MIFLANTPTSITKHSMPHNTHSLKVRLVGDAGVGKTTLLTRLRTGEFVKNYIATMGIETTQLIFQTNKGPVTLHLSEWSGQEKFNALRPDPEVHGVIVMFDVTSRTSYRNARVWAQRAREDETPLVLCGNKVDAQERKVKPAEITLQRDLACQYYDLSAKSNYNFEKPFLYLIRRVLGEDTVLV
jgi:GTP-binding nuclear protein Ran